MVNPVATVAQVIPSSRLLPRGAKLGGSPSRYGCLRELAVRIPPRAVTLSWEHGGERLPKELDGIIVAQALMPAAPALLSAQRSTRWASFRFERNLNYEDTL